MFHFTEHGVWGNLSPVQLSPISAHKSLFATIADNNHHQQHIVIENNEKFTHLIRFYQKLSQQNEEYVHKIESSLFNIFGKNIELFSKVIFQGMHSMLYKVSIPMIQQLIQLIICTFICCCCCC